ARPAATSDRGMDAQTGTSAAYAQSSIVQGSALSRSIRLAALRQLALTFRRARRFDDAAACWRQLLDVPQCPAHLTREANQALAIHHEHRVRDLAVARVF